MIATSMASETAQSNGRLVKLRDRMTPLSQLRYLAWRVGLLGDEVAVTFSTGERLLLQKSMVLGLAVAYEIFVMDTYRCPREISPASVRRIVDVGANVGYSLIYWKSKFPTASIDAFEPHPQHLRLLRRSLRLNRIEAQVNVHPVAVGPVAGTFELIDAGTASAIAQGAGASNSQASSRLQVEVVDFFQAIDNQQIDLLKLDCEGSEYGILMDPRFAEINARNLVMEWHSTVEHPEACAELTAHLRELDWEVQPGQIAHVEMLEGLGMLGAGILWAFRQ
jgi:FkbM family methyltransferase